LEPSLLWSLVSYLAFLGDYLRFSLQLQTQSVHLYNLLKMLPKDSSAALLDNKQQFKHWLLTSQAKSKTPPTALLLK
jgi:hypothetical protein